MTDEELYKKYSHIIDGSIEHVQHGQVICGGKNNKIIAHGRIVVIRCADSELKVQPPCLKTRIINIQDVAQTKYCTACIKRRRNKRRRIKRRK
ncbi:hypothetical protein KAR91_70915 [Candidatus Pacearchaeota archaeon]|nr:hypothetical protein [Candidatus Pacearchaeota archaeon]